MNDFNRASGLVIDGGTARPTSSGITINANDLANMTGEQRREELRRVDALAAQAQRDQKEAALRAQVDTATERGLLFNQQLQAQRMGVNTGQALNEGQSRIAKAASDAPHAHSAPQALIDQLPVKVGGIELGPQQAKDMLARGEIRQADYAAAVNHALKPYGYSFR
ncbi:hypothetical protein [Mesorhizobium jarvisii]|uniref:hypothetical protein n=1 Tax=Mesorhizobium jarvisii TaxID=1777867 RepID=UPI00049B485A|nr:hypothetical protein [Mesorhizobium jarvisii]AID30572.1 hypothetical protein MCHK_2762 [Mesorhizobium huakuii 7653R]MCH4561021.1 hypothetical protein [Mesorhizobium jarvisii]